MAPEKHKKLTEEDYLKYYFDIPYEGTTSAGRPLKKLKNIVCPYRGIIMIPGEQINPFEKKLSKIKTAVEGVELLKTYKKHILPTEKDILSIFNDFVNLNPNDNLQNCLKMIKESSLTRLKLEEFEVLDDVDILTRKLCSKTALEVREKTTKCRQLIISDSKHEVFKRKTFLNSLNDISFKENERETMNAIRNKALFLPTSESSKNAFIVKYSNRSQKEIIRRIFIASTATIEHVVPASNGGANTLSNFLLTCAAGNRYRENMSLTEYLKRHPKISKYAQLYIDCIINAIHDGELKGNETYPYKIKRRLFEESYGHIAISLSNYKYSEQDAICAVKEYEQRYLKYKK